MSTLPTRFTERFGARHAFAQAGMAFAGQEPELAVAVSRAGGVGAIGVGFTAPERLREIVAHLRSELGDLPFNINFITSFGNEETVAVAAELRVPVVSFHWGHPPQHQLDLLHDAGVSIWEQSVPHLTRCARSTTASMSWSPRAGRRVSAYDLTCWLGYDLTCRSRHGDHGMVSPPLTRVRRSLRR